MASKTYPVFGGGAVATSQLTFPLIAPTPGGAGSEPFRFATGGGLHGDSSGGVALSVAAGDAVTADAQANVSLPQALKVVKLATLAGGLSSPSASLGQLTVTGDTSLGGNIGVAGSVQVTGDLTARKITATSDLSAASLSTQGHIAGGSLTITGQTTLAGLDVQGTFHASDIQSDGNFYFPASSPNAPGIALADEHGTGLFAAPGTIGLAVGGQSALSFGQNLAANFAAGVSAPFAAIADVLANTLEVSSGAVLHALQATTLALSDAATFASNLDVQGNLQVEGTTRLANLAIDMLSTDHDLTVGGNATVKGATSLQGTLFAQGDATLAGNLSASGAGSFASLSAGSFATSSVLLDRLRQRGGNAFPGNLPPYVDSDPDPHRAGAIISYTALLAPGGVLKIAGDFTALGGGTFGGAVSMGDLTAGQGTFSGPGSFVGALTAASLAVGGFITAATSTIGGSTFQTCQGTPNGQVVGSVGDWVIDSNAGQAYLKQSGSQTNIGWVEVTTQANATGFPLLAPDGQPAAVPYGFAADGGSGLGRNSQLGLYLAVAGSAVLSFASGGAATFAQGVTAQGSLSVQGALAAQSALSVQGATTLAGLTAGTTQLGQLTAGATTVGSLAAQATQVTTLQASGLATLAQLLVQGDSALQGTLAVAKAVSSQVSLAAPSILVGSADITSGSGNPNGQVAGSQGDLFIQQDTAALWQKTDASANAGWLKAGGGAGNFPLAAPLSANFAAPSYGFKNSQMGLTDNGANVLVAVTGGTVGWTLDASQNFALAAAFSAVGAGSFGGALSVAGPSTLAALSAAAITGSTTLTIAGASSLARVTAAAIQATSLTTTTGSVTSAQNVTAAATLSGLLVVSNGSTWRAATSAPSSSVGQAGDLASIQGTSDHPLQVRVGSAWKQVALVGDPTPSQFPLTGPADSASAPNYSTALSPNTGMYFPGANQIAWSTNGLRAGSVDASQNWSFVGAVSGAAATFSGLTVNGSSSLTGNISIGGTLQATGMATFASSITAQSAAISQGITASQATINGALGVQTVTTTGDVSIGGNLTVSGTTTYTGVQRSGYFQTGDGTISAPAYAFTNETGLGIWRKGTGNLAFAAAGANLLSLTAATAAFSGSGSFPGTVSAAVVDAPVVRNSGGTLALQAGTATILSVGASTIGAAVPVYVPAGNSSAPGLVIGAGGGLFSANDTRPTFPVSVTLTNPRGGGISLTSVPDYNTVSTYFIFGHGAAGITSGGVAPNGYANGAPGYLYQNAQGGSGNSLWVYESTSGGNGGWVAVRTASQAVVPSYPAVGPAGTAAAPTFAVGSANTGLFAGTDAMSRAFVGLSQGGAAVARLATFTNNSTAVYLLGLGDPTSSSVSGGLLASAQAPSTGAPLALPGMLYEDTRGGPSPVWVNESTTATPAWAKVLTTSSSVAATFPLLAPADSATAPSYSWAAESGLGWYRSAAATLVAVAAGAPLATLTTNLVTLPGALRVGGTNAGLTSSGTNLLALQTAGTTALSFAATGVATFAFQAIHAAGTAALPGIAVSASNYGVYLSTTANQGNEGSVSVAYKGKAVANFFQGLINAGPNSYYAMTLGDPSQTAQLGGILAGAITPVGNIIGTGGQLYQFINGGAATSLFVYEGTTSGSSTWAKVLTTSSTITPTFPMQSPTLGSATAPAYGFSTSGYTTTGIWAAQDGSGGGSGYPALCITANGVNVAYFESAVANSIPVYTLCFGNPAVNASPYNACIRASNQVASGNVIGAVGQLAINPTGGPGTVLAVKESGVGTTSGWNFVLTQGTTQFASGNGTVAAPLYAFSGDKTTGAYLGDLPYFSHLGKQAFGYGSNFAGAYPGICLGPGNTDGVPYFIGVPSTAASAGNPNTLAIQAARCAVLLNAAGAAGNQLWIHEPAASSSGWVRVLTESTALSFSRLLQTTAPATVSGQAQIWADTANLIRLSIFGVNASSAPTLKQEIVATPYGASQAITQANNNTTIISNQASQYTLTLPASSSTIDLCYRFQVETAAGVIIQAATGQLIYVGGTVTSATGGSITTTTVGATIELFCRAGTNNWFARGPAGTWTVS